MIAWDTSDVQKIPLAARIIWKGRLSWTESVLTGLSYWQLCSCDNKERAQERILLMFWQTDRQTDRQAETETDTQRETSTDRTDADTQTDRKVSRHKDMQEVEKVWRSRNIDFQLTSAKRSLRTFRRARPHLPRPLLDPFSAVGCRVRVHCILGNFLQTADHHFFHLNQPLLHHALQQTLQNYVTPWIVSTESWCGYVKHRKDLLSWCFER